MRGLTVDHAQLVRVDHLSIVGCLAYRQTRNTPYRLWLVSQDAQAAGRRLYEKSEQV